VVYLGRFFPTSDFIPRSGDIEEQAAFGMHLGIAGCSLMTTYTTVKAVETYKTARVIIPSILSYF
jgi:hypothetical protein